MKEMDPKIVYLDKAKAIKNLSKPARGTVRSESLSEIGHRYLNHDLHRPEASERSVTPDQPAVGAA
jgi:hypothetical protein